MCKPLVHTKQVRFLKVTRRELSIRQVKSEREVHLNKQSSAQVEAVEFDGIFGFIYLRFSKKVFLYEDWSFKT